MAKKSRGKTQGGDGKKISAFYNQLCEPAQLYLILSVVGIVFYLYLMAGKDNDYKTGGLVVQIVFGIAWLCIVQYLCRSSLGKKIAWAIVLLPFFFYLLILVLVMCFVGSVGADLMNDPLFREALREQNQLQIEGYKNENEPRMKMNQE